MQKKDDEKKKKLNQMESQVCTWNVRFRSCVRVLGILVLIIYKLVFLS